MPENKPRLIVLGGSFNPPTIAHQQLMLHALTSAKAQRGVFVPSSDSYVTRKAARAGTSRVFSEHQRLNMLYAMTNQDERLGVSTCEYGDQSTGRSYKTMREVQAAWPDYECCFLTGADKLHILPRWKNIGQFVNEFRFVVLSRDKDEAEAIINTNNFLAHNKDRFIIIPELKGYSHISSSVCQKLMAETGLDSARPMLHPYVYDYVKNMC